MDIGRLCGYALFFLDGAICLSAGHQLSPTLRFTYEPAGNRTTTGSLFVLSKDSALPTSPQGRLPLWLCAAFEGSPTLVHARSGYRLSFHHGIQARQLIVLLGIHYFDAQTAPELGSPSGYACGKTSTCCDRRGRTGSCKCLHNRHWRLFLRYCKHSSEWPSLPDAVDDRTEQEIASAADQLDILISKPKTAVTPFCNPANLGLLPYLWLQARLQFTQTAIQEKFSRIMVSIEGNCGYEAKVRPLKLYCLE